MIHPKIHLDLDSLVGGRLQQTHGIILSQQKIPRDMQNREEMEHSSERRPEICSVFESSFSSISSYKFMHEIYPNPFPTHP